MMVTSQMRSDLGHAHILSREDMTEVDLRPADGQTTDDILALYPDFQADDVCEALLFAAEAVRESA